MTIEDKIKIAIAKGYKCDIENGVVYGIKGILKAISSQGYYIMSIRHEKKDLCILQHQFIFYTSKGYVPKYIDHIDQNKLNNSINNLREVSNQQNGFNRQCKGFYKTKNTYWSKIVLDGKQIYLGAFKTEIEAKNAYDEAKKLYHII